jgi:membrane protease YdiL (CAAX protease family)
LGKRPDRHPPASERRLARARVLPSASDDSAAGALSVAHGERASRFRRVLAEGTQPRIRRRVCTGMQTSQRWPIGTTGALWLAFLLVIGHYLAMFGVGGVLTILLGIEDRREIWQAPPAAFIINIGVGLFEIGVVLRLGMCRYARLSFREVGWIGLALRDVAYGVLGFVLLAVSVTCVLATDSGFADAITYIADRIAHYTPQQRVFFVLMGVIAAIPEETIFRGILQPTLQAKVGRWPGILVTAVIFALYHVHFAFSLPRVISHMCSGLILGLLRERTGTLWAPAIAHALLWVIFGAI